jgi:hypothetical protein
MCLYKHHDLHYQLSLSLLLNGVAVMLQQAAIDDATRGSSSGSSSSNAAVSGFSLTPPDG